MSVAAAETEAICAAFRKSRLRVNGCESMSYLSLNYRKIVTGTLHQRDDTIASDASWPITGHSMRRMIPDLG
jgi:hypothetical protein